MWRMSRERRVMQQLERERDAKIAIAWCGWRKEQDENTGHVWILPPEMKLNDLNSVQRQGDDDEILAIGSIDNQGESWHTFKRLPKFSQDIQATERLLKHLREKHNLAMKLWIYPRGDLRYNPNNSPYECHLSCRDEPYKTTYETGNTMLEAIASAALDMAKPLGDSNK